VANTRKGRNVLGVDATARAILAAEASGDHVAIVGENRKLLVFPLSQVPEMSRARAFASSATRMAACLTPRCSRFRPASLEGHVRTDLDRVRPELATGSEPRGGRPPAPEGLPEDEQVRVREADPQS
jgi:hypothetical protein